MKKIFVKIIILVLSLVIIIGNQTLLVSAIDNAAIDETLKNEALESDYILIEKERVPTPKTYTLDRVIKYLGPEALYFKKPEGLYIDKNDYIYVADTDNNRILKLASDGTAERIFTGPEEKPFKKPTGVYVDDDGAIYVADMENHRIVHLSSTGEFVEEFTKPETELLGEEAKFVPRCVYISPTTGYIYCVRHQSLMIIDAYNNFRGYVGAAEVGFDLKWFLVRVFASREQKKALVKKQAPPIVNFTITDDGEIYVVSQDNNYGQIKKINSIGKNIYPIGFYGEKVLDKKSNTTYEPYLADIAVDKKGIISVLQQNNGRVYQYDQEGNMIASFGGLGDRRGRFKMPVAIDIDSKGYIYVLDKDLENIQVFKPTKYVNLIHEGISLYSDGKYLEAYEIWNEVLLINQNYMLANKGIGKALTKQDEWSEALEQYRLADDKIGYSTAFVKVRYNLIREYFGFVLLAVVVGVVIIIKLLKSLKKYSDKVIETFINFY